MRQSTIDIRRSLLDIKGRSSRQADASGGGDQDGDTAPAPARSASARPSIAALRSAGGHRRRQLPHETSPSPRRYTLKNQLIQPRGAGTLKWPPAGTSTWLLRSPHCALTRSSTSPARPSRPPAAIVRQMNDRHHRMRLAASAGSSSVPAMCVGWRRKPGLGSSVLAGRNRWVR